MRFIRPRARSEAEFFDLTPMIDVVMQLIIFFMFTSQFAQVIRSKLDLPQEPGEREMAQQERALVIDIQPNGALVVGGEPADRERLVSIITSEAAEAGGASGLKVVVRADRNAPSRHLNAVAADLAALGVRGWRIATAPAGGSGGGGAR